MERRVCPEARAGSGQHFHIITTALHAHSRARGPTLPLAIRSPQTCSCARDPTTFNDSLAKSLGDVMSAHCTTCLWLFKWFIFIDCFCLVARQKIMIAVWIRLLLCSTIAKVIATAMQFKHLVMECVTRKWVVKCVRLEHSSLSSARIVMCRQVLYHVVYCI